MMAASDARHIAKRRYIFRLAAKYDILTLTEVHGSQGECDAWLPPEGHTARLSASGQSDKAGIGIIVKNIILQQI